MHTDSKQSTSGRMARIRSRDTKPEMIVRRHLFSRGYRYRKNVKGLPGTPDIVLRKYGVAIFIHGCFWHGHEGHYRLPATNREFWQRKIERNRQRDARDKDRLRAMGWDVITIWECQLKRPARQQTLMELEYHINRLFLARMRKKEGLDTPSASPGTLPIAAEPEAPYGEE